MYTIRVCVAMHGLRHGMHNFSYYLHVYYTCLIGALCCLNSYSTEYDIAFCISSGS